MTPTTKAMFAVALMSVSLAVPHLAHAQTNKDQYTYRCTGKDGKKYYGQTIPQSCVGQPMELINKHGLVVKRIDPEAEEKARLAKEAEAERKRESEAAEKDAVRRNRALLATYTSEKDIQDSRARALRDHQRQVQEVEGRIEELKKRQARFEKDLALYKEAGKGEPPSRLKEEVTNVQIDLKAQQSLLDAKRKEADGINARYDDDLARYRQVTGTGPGGRAKALGLEKGVTVTAKPASPHDEHRQQWEDQRQQAEAQNRVERERWRLRELEMQREADFAARQRAEAERRKQQ